MTARNNSTPRDPYELIIKLVDQQTNVLQEVQLKLVEVNGVLGQLVQTAGETKNDLREMRPKLDTAISDLRLLWDEVYGSDGKAGLTTRHGTLKDRFEQRDTQFGVWKFIIATPWAAALVYGISKLANVLPPNATN